jgi:hypothetical protein
MFKIFPVELFLVIGMVGFDFDPIHMMQENDYEVVVSRDPQGFFKMKKAQGTIWIPCT